MESIEKPDEKSLRDQFTEENEQQYMFEKQKVVKRGCYVNRLLRMNQEKHETQLQESSKLVDECENLCNVKRWQRLRDTNHELRQLEATLREAYTAKALQSQIAEREAALSSERAQERYATEEMRRKEEELNYAEYMKRIENTRKSKKYREYLEDQMIAKEMEKISLYEEAQKERKILEEVSRVIELEDLKLLREKRELADRMMREMQIFQEVKEIRKQQEEEVLRKECERNKQYIEQMEKKAAMMKQLRDKQVAARMAMIEAVARMILDVESKKLERESIIADLVAEEKKLEILVREHEEELRRRKMREAMVLDMERQRRLVEERKLRLEMEDKMFADAVMRKIMEDNRIDRLTTEARRRKQIQYRKELEQIMQERRARHALEVLKLQESLKSDQECEKLIQDQVREERKRLLMKHAQNVAGFINKAALTAEECETMAEQLSPQCNISNECLS